MIRPAPADRGDSRDDAVRRSRAAHARNRARRAGALWAPTRAPSGPRPKPSRRWPPSSNGCAWYGDPESLDLRDALAAKHGCSPSKIVVGAGIDDLMGLAVRAFVAAGRPGADDARHLSDLQLSRRRIRRRPRLRTVSRRTACRISTRWSAAARERAAVDPLPGESRQSQRHVSSARDEMERFYAALPPDALLLLDEAYADFVDESELLPPRFEDRLIRMRTFSKAYGMAGARIGYALGRRRDASQTFQKIRLHYGVNRNAQIGALASLADDEFRQQSSAKRRAARAEYYALAARAGLGLRSNRARTSSASIIGSARARDARDGRAAARAASGSASRAPRRSTATFASAPARRRCARAFAARVSRRPWHEVPA